MPATNTITAAGPLPDDPQEALTKISNASRVGVGRTPSPDANVRCPRPERGTRLRQRSRWWGACQSSSGPAGTIPDGLSRGWVPK
jgi:hypothetical protein